MKCKVLEPYTDRITDEVHMPGETVDVTAARADELSKGGYVRKQPARRAASKK